MKTIIVTKHLILKKAHKKYWKDYVKAFSIEVRKPLHLEDWIETSGLEYTKNALEKQARGDEIYYYIYNNNVLIGAIEIRKETHEKTVQDGSLGAWINEKYWGTGFYQEAVIPIMKEWFRITDEKEITANIDKSNLRSLKAHKKLGFQIIGESIGKHAPQYNLVITKKQLL